MLVIFDDPAMRVSPETIYQSLYLYPCGGSCAASCRPACGTGREIRRRRGRREVRGRIIGAVLIGQRVPAEVAGLVVPGHYEGDLINMGSKASNSAVGIIAQRTTRLPSPCLPLLAGHDAASKTPTPSSTAWVPLPAWFARTPDLGSRHRTSPPPAHHRRHRHHRLLRRPLRAPRQRAGN